LQDTPSIIKRYLKLLATGIALVVAFPWALLSGFGRLKPVFTFFAHTFALAPGKIGDYIRLGYYMQTLRGCSRESMICFGAYFVHPEASVGRLASIGPYCIIGRAVIGDGSKLAGMVQILSGTQQHKRDPQGKLSDEGRQFIEIVVGQDCWIGASAVIMADIGAGSTVAPGSIVLTPVAPGAIVGGNPARRTGSPG
jgi:virginiamycin A acetyltransferase